MKYLLTLYCLLLFVSCTRKYGVSAEFRKGIPSDMQQWVLDSSYRLYIREVFLDTMVRGDRQVKADNEVYNKNDKLIEIEYLLLSTEKKRAVYISTIPDKYQLYYAKKAKYLKREHLNAYDFSTFRFGKKADNSNTIVFDNINTGHSDTWIYEIEQDSILHVKEVVERINGEAVNIYFADEAIDPNASFIRTDSFKIAFRNMDKEKKNENRLGRPPKLRLSIDNIIYYRNKKDKYTIYFRFNRNLVALKDSAVSFNNTRLVNIPFQ